MANRFSELNVGEVFSDGDDCLELWVKLDDVNAKCIKAVYADTEEGEVFPFGRGIGWVFPVK